MPTREPFDALWSQKPFKFRCIKFFLDDDPVIAKELQLLAIQNRKAVNHFSQHIYASLLSGVFPLSKLGDRTFLDVIKSELDDYIRDNFSLYLSRQRRGACFAAARFYKGYGVRAKNKKIKLPPKAPTLRQNKAMYIQDNIVKDRKGKLVITVTGKTEKGKPRSICASYTIPKGMQWKHQHLGKSLGGQLIFSDDGIPKCFTARVTLPYEWAYTPKTVIGMDFNLSAGDFVALSEKISYSGPNSTSSMLVDRIPQTQQISNLILRLKKLNSETKKIGVNSRQRRGIRKKIQAAHKRLKTLCEPICLQIMDWAKKNNSLIAIDQLSVGAKTGSFGHDKLREIFTATCEKFRIPFVSVPTHWGSQICHVCGHKGERPATDKFQCANKDKECQKNKSAQINAAFNVAKFGWKIWTEGVKAHKASIKEFKTTEVYVFSSGPTSGV